MGRVLVLAALLAVMLALRSIQGLSAGAYDPLILAAIGFVVMASFTAAELFSLLTLPRVSGYIAAGLLLGPSVGNILSTSVVQDMTMFNTLAQGLIALSAGLELDLGAQRRLWRTLAATIGAKIVLAGGAVVGGFVAIESLWHPLGLSTMGEQLAVGLVLGTLAVGTSPAISLALITELNTKSRLGDLVLGAAIAKDLVLVVLLAIAISVGAGLLGVAPGHGNILATLGIELGGSVAVGAALGLLLIGYVRFIKAEMLLFVAGLVLAAAELSRALHLDLLLVFIAAGFVVRNFSQQWEETLHAIETVSLPVFVVFFTIAGARIDLQATWQVLPVALSLTLLRAGAFFGAAKIGNRVGQEGAVVERWAWLAYLPQAGVTLTLLEIAVGELETVGKPLGNIGLACVALNLAVGPITLRRALQRSQEAPGSDEEASSAARPTMTPDVSIAPLQHSIAPAVIDTGNLNLDKAVLRLRESLEKQTSDIVKELLRPQVQTITEGLSGPLSAESPRVFAQRLHAWALDGHAKAAGEQAVAAGEAVCQRFLGRLEEVPALLRVPYAPLHLDSAPGEGLRLRLARARLRVRARLSRKARKRRVPLRMVSRVCLAPRLTALAQQLQGSVCRAHIRVLTELRRAAVDDLELTELADGVSQHLSELERNFRSDAAAAIEAGLRELVNLVRDIDSPTRDFGSVRYSQVEPEVRSRTAARTEEAEAWIEVLCAAEQQAIRDTAARRLREAADEALETHVLLPLAEAADALEPMVGKLRGQLREALSHARKTDDLEGACASLANEFASLLSDHEQSASGRGDRFRAAAALHSMTTDLRSLVDALPEESRLLGPGQDALQVADPTRLSIRTYHPRSDARRELVEEFLPVLDLQSRRASAAVQDLDARLTEALEMALSVVRPRPDEELPERDAIDQALELAQSNLEQGTDQARKQLIGAHDAIAEAFGTAVERLMVGRAGAPELRAAARAALTRPITRWLNFIGQRVRGVLQRAGQLLRIARGSGLAERLAQRVERPQDLRTLLSREVAEAVPKSYSRLFRLEAEQDLRLCVARAAQLATINQAQARWREGGSGAVLLVGDAGSGRTTLMNATQREIVGARVLRPELVRTRRKQGLVRALAYELGRAAVMREVRLGLRQERTVVLIDDLEQWFTPDAAGLAQLRAFLDLVRLTRGTAFWSVSVSASALSLLAETVSVEDVFSDVLHLAPLSRQELRQTIEARHALSGLSLEHPRISGGFLARFLRFSEADLVFRVLHAVSGGNPAAALSLWLNSVRVEDKRVVVLVDKLVSQRLPRLSVLDIETSAVLMQLLRFGPMSAVRLSESLALPVARVRRRLSSLQDVGLLVGQGGSEVAIARPWRGMVSAQLPLQTEWRT